MSLGLDRLRIIIRDDRPGPGRMTGAALERAGFRRVWVAASDRELLHLAGEVRPHVAVLVDHGGRGSAFDVVCAIRGGRGGPNRDLAIVMVTDPPSLAFLAAAESCDVNEVLARPITPESLLGAVNRALAPPPRAAAPGHRLGADAR